jgi:hypothetical protein
VKGEKETIIEYKQTRCGFVQKREKRKRREEKRCVYVTPFSFHLSLSLSLFLSIPALCCVSIVHCHIRSLCVPNSKK